MRLVFNSQSYRYRTTEHERQLEIGKYLRRNKSYPDINKMCLLTMCNPPAVLQGMAPVEVVNSKEQITNAVWFRWAQRQGSGTGLFLSSDIDPNEGLGI
jgi:hypothetical protein